MMTDWQNRIIGLEQMPAHQLLANPLNARRHPGKQREALRGSLDTLGWYDAVILNQRTGYLIDGHARVEEQLTRDENAMVPVLVVDMSEAEEAQALASHDWITQLAEYDKQTLDDLLRATNSDDQRVQALLSDLAQEHGLFVDSAQQSDAPEAKIDDAEKLREKWQTESGQLWIIPSAHSGQHKLLCGDSTNADDVLQLMSGQKADAVITDPPYGQNQNGITNDEPEKLNSIVKGAVINLPVENAIVCAFQSPRTFVNWLDCTRNNGFKFERMLWLYKAAQMTYPWRGWILKSESILISSIGKPVWNDVHPYSHDCYYLSEVSNELPKNAGWHGSVKPLSVVSDIVARISTHIVYDPFGGSGTTMVACEKLKRQCRMIEIEPKYCAVILQRMADMGLQPTLQS